MKNGFFRKFLEIGKNDKPNSLTSKPWGVCMWNFANGLLGAMNRLLVTIIVCMDGLKWLVTAYVVFRGLAVNKEMYINKCLQERLLPFINSNHPPNSYVFWPDKSSSHYANATQEFLHANNVFEWVFFLVQVDTFLVQVDTFLVQVDTFLVQIITLLVQIITFLV